MWVLYSLLGLLVLLIAALSVPVYGQLTYDGELRAFVRVLGIPITLLPQEEEKTKASSSSDKTAKTPKKSKEDKPSKFQELLTLMKQDDLSGTLQFLREIASLATKTVGRLLRAITVTQLNLQLLIATGDAASTAQRYGQVCGVLYPALTAIEGATRVRQRHIRMEPNFLLDKSVIRFEVKMRMSMWRLLGAGIALLWGFLMIKEQNEPHITKEVS